MPDRESNEIKYLREATDLIEKWQHQLQDGQPVSQPSSEHSEVIVFEGSGNLPCPFAPGSFVSVSVTVNSQEDTSIGFVK